MMGFCLLNKVLSDSIRASGERLEESGGFFLDILSRLLCRDSGWSLDVKHAFNHAHHNLGRVYRDNDSRIFCLVQCPSPAISG